MEILFKLRKSKKLTQKDVAIQLGITRQAYANYETGNRNPDPKMLKKIANLFEVSIDDLLENNTTQKENPNDKGELSKHETALLNAYRNHPEMQPAVDKLLGIYNEEYVQLYTAASSKDNRPDEFINMPREKWEKIKKTPDTDDSLM